MELKERLNDYFKRYPTSKEVFENGGVLFHSRGAADSFGKSETKKYTRKSSQKETGSDEKEAMTLFIRGVEDVSTLKYENMKVAVKQLGLEVSDEKKETFINALNAFKETLKDE